MQVDIPQAFQSETAQEAQARKARILLSRIGALRTLIGEEEDDENQYPGVTALPALRQGLRELEQLASELCYELQAGHEFLLAELPDIPLPEALSQLVETTAETLGLSSRVAFSGRERPLSDYLSRLLYRIVQETLARVAQHVGGRRLRFNLDYRRSEIGMLLEDDGIPGEEKGPLADVLEERPTFPPFLATDQEEKSVDPPDQVMHHLRTVVENLGGTLTTNSGVEQGTQIQVHIPYYRPPELPIEQAVPSANQEAPAPDKKIKLLLVDAQAVSRVGLHRLLEGYRDLAVVGEASDSVQAVSETAELLPQIVLIDAQLPGEQSLEIVRQVRQLNAEIHTLLLSGQENEELLYEALRAGANGYILKDIAPDELAQAIRVVAQGEILVQPQLAARLLARTGDLERSRAGGSAQESLTAREREVLQLLARGLRNKEIAARLIVSERTVNFHLANIYAKLHVSGRTEALSKALEQGLIKV